MRFIDRKREFTFLNQLKTYPDGQMVLMYGRRRVGKTVLLRHWAEQSGLRHIYWAAEKEPPALQRRKFFARCFGNAAPSTQFETWADCFAAVAQTLGQEHTILIIDELPYAADADSAFLSALQHAWDHLFKPLPLILILCGSHVNVMERLMNRQSPLYGRFRRQWRLQPLPFCAIREFGERWSADERVAIYAIVGGIPAYLEWLDPQLSFSDNLRDVLLDSGSLFIAEPEFLLYDEVREPRNYLAILKAIGSGAHTIAEIQRDTLLSKSHLTTYLARLQQLYMVERRIPATVRPQHRHQSRRGRYHLSDAYFRFYFRFIAPRIADIAYRPERVLPVIRQQLRAFIGMSAWEELSRQWVDWFVDPKEDPALPYLGWLPENIGSHWSRTVQVDVVAVSWTEKRLLIGECKWQPNAVSRKIVQDLVEHKTPKLLDSIDKAEQWKIQHACFGRGGFTDAAQQYAIQHQVELIDLPRLDRDLHTQC
ncbi:MAG: ATP-binding protein [Candidatus Promineifilaceae bacterium]